MIDIMNNMIWFFAGICTCAGFVLLVLSRFIPAIVTRAVVQRRVTLIELLDAMAKEQIVSKAIANKIVSYTDDVDKLAPEVARALKKVTLGDVDGKN